MAGEEKIAADITIAVAKEIAKEAYEDGARPVVKSLGGVLATIPQLINAALFPIHKWIANKEYQIEETKKILAIKLSKINPEDIESPEAYIAVPAFQAIAYSMDNAVIRNMYANLLAASMTKAIKGDVHPAYVEIIKQLSPDEARILRYIYTGTNGAVPVISLRTTDKTTQKRGGMDVVTNFTTLYRMVNDLEVRDYRKTELYVDNLVRLKLLELHKGSYLSSPGIYDEIENDEVINNAKIKYHQQEGWDWKFSRTYLGLTSFGKAFCKLCLS